MDFFKDIKPLTKYSSRNDDSFSYPPGATSTPSVEIKRVAPPENPYSEPIKTTMTKRYIPVANDRPLRSDFRHKRSSSSGQGLWVFAILALVVLAVVISFKYATAVVIITPKMRTVTVNQTLVLSKDTPVIPFETTSVDSSIKEQIILTEQVSKQEKATGTITLYNTYNTAGQPLVAGTRFTSKSGLIYKLDKAVTIPGYTTVDGKKVPGSVVVNVTADGFGEKYNTTNATFSVVVFTGTPKFESIYAKVADPIAGGLDGSYFTQGDDFTRDMTEDVARLTSKLSELIQKQIPSDYLFIKGLNTLTVTEKNILFSKEASADMGVEGSLTQIVFSQEAFKKYIFSKYASLDPNAPLDLTAITGKIVNVQDTGSDPVYTVLLEGDIQQVMTLDTQKIKEQLVGIKKGSFTDAIAESSETISSAELSIKPFWVGRIPKSFSRIIIENTNDRK